MLDRGTRRTAPARRPWAVILAVALAGPAGAADVPVADANVAAGLSPYNWAVTADAVSTTVCGASLTVGFRGTRHVVLKVDTSRIVVPDPTRYPILAWTVDGGPVQTHQLVAGETSIVLCTDRADPVIDLYVKGMCPWIDRHTGNPPPNAVTIRGFAIDDGGATVAVEQPPGIWLSIGDSITSGDGAAYAEKQGRPPEAGWAASDDGRASYAWLLARHFGCREARLAYGGYNWTGGIATADGVHPTAAGHDTIFRKLLPRLEPIVRQVKSHDGQTSPPRSESSPADERLE